MKAHQSREGSVLIVALILSLAMAVAVGSFIALSLDTLKRSTRSTFFNNSLNVAEAGLEHAMWSMNNSFDGSPLTWVDGYTTYLDSEGNPFPTKKRLGSAGTNDVGATNGFFDVFVEKAYTVTQIQNQIDSMKATGKTTDQVRNWIEEHMPVVHARGVVQPPTGGPLKKELKLKLAVRSPWENGMVGRTRIDLDGGDIGSYDSQATPNVPANLAAMGYGITVASPTSVIGNVAIGTPADIRGHLSVGIGAENSASFLASIKGSIIGPTTPSGTTVDPDLVSYDFNESYEDVSIPTGAEVAASTGLPVTELTALPSVVSAGTHKGWIVIGDPTGATVQRYSLTGDLDSENLLILGPVIIVLSSGDFSPDGTYVLDGTKDIPQLKSNGNPDSAEDTTTGKGWAEVYVEGDITLNGAPGSLNLGSSPSLLKVFGTISSSEDAAGNTQAVNLNGNANITALVYAPFAEVKLNGGGSSGFFAGALVADTIKIGGNGYRFVYDVSAANEDITGFRLSRWIEFVKGPDPTDY